MELLSGLSSLFGLLFGLDRLSRNRSESNVRGSLRHKAKRRDPNRTGRWALCITGEHRHVAQQFTISHLLRNLAGALPALPDLFVSTTDTFRNGTLLERQAVHVRRAPDMSSQELRQAFNKSRAVPQDVLGCGHHSLCGLLRQLRSTWDCWRDIEAHEQRKAFRYDFVGRTRIDMLWYDALGATELSRLLHKREAVIPSGDDWGGLNDRFVLARRADFHVYARLYEDLRLSRDPWDTKTLRAWDRKQKKHVVVAAEMALLWQLKFARISVARPRLPVCLLRRSPHNRSCAYCKKYTLPHEHEGRRALERFRDSTGCHPSNDSVVHFCVPITRKHGGSALTTRCLPAREVEEKEQERRAEQSEVGGRGGG